MADLGTPEIKRIDWFEESQLRMCMYCRYAGVFFNTDDNLESVVCLHSSTRKLQKKGRASNREFRTYLKVMDSMESCDNWKPTEWGSDRVKVLEWLGLLGSLSEAM